MGLGVGLQPGQELAQEGVEGAPIGRAQRLEQSLLVGHVRLDRPVDRDPPLPREANEGPATVSRVGSIFSGLS